MFGCETRINAIPCTSGGGVSHAVHVPPSACHCSTMLWRRKSSTEMVLVSAEAMLAACRIHRPLKISVAKISRRRSPAGCVGERALHGAWRKELWQNHRLG